MKKLFIVFALFSLLTGSGHAGDTRQITDALGRTVTLPADLERVICSGSGALRLLAYLGAQEMAVGVDDIEGRTTKFDARPYAIANPQFKTLPIFGQFRGFDQPERILALSPQPQVIFKIKAAFGHDPLELEAKTGIPVIVLDYGDLGANREALFSALRIMGEAVGRGDRAEAVIAFMQEAIEDLARRTADIPEGERVRVFVGGIALKGARGLQSTEPAYPPFTFVNAVNVAREGQAGTPAHADVSKEQIIAWDPDVVFLDLSTRQMGEQAGGEYELKTDPAYRALRSVQNGKVYGLLPYNFYSQNFGSIIADAYYIGKTLYPERFADVDPAAKADDIYRFLVNRPVYDAMKKAFGPVFAPVDVN